MPGKGPFALAVLVTGSALAGCSGTDDLAGPAARSAPVVTPVAPSRTVAAGSVDTGSSGPTGVSSSAPVRATGAESRAGEAPVVEPPRPTAPAPTTAGALDARALPTPSGWHTQVGDGADGGYIPNGSWVNARDAHSTANEILALGCRQAPAGWPVPTAALEGSYVGPAGASGTSVVLELASAAAATRFLQIHREQGRSCAPPDYEEIDVSADRLVDRRVLEGDPTRWLEVVGVRDRQVTFLMLQEQAGPLTPAQIDAVVESVTR
ncbi:hypothetical protein [Arsenicicoccus dermatophilus]|uniref:hypothetical protein n=1 Tax=Arsenicicoccus dermatophilus TaxID=1076331 RepID=UPI003916D71B